MVRVISEKLFSPPRSRHSSGEAVDKELAARAVEALSSLNAASSSSARRSLGAELSDYESSSDSHWEWDSEVDLDGPGDATSSTGGAAYSTDENSVLGGECSGGEDVLQKRKERRRERNKLSAQAYRIRRREQCVKQQTVLKDLQDKNWRLKEQVHSLEEEIDQLRRTAVVGAPPPPPPPRPGLSKASTPTSSNTADFSPTGVERPPSLRPLGSEVLQERRSCPGYRGPMDNDSTRSRLLTSPLVDNFSYSQPSPGATSSPVTSPCAGSSSSSSRFTFPSTFVTSTSSGAGLVVGQDRHVTCPKGKVSQASVVAPVARASSSSSAEDGGHFSRGRAHPRSQYLSQIVPPPPLSAAPQSTDLNANAEEGRGSGNLNLSLHTAAALGSCQRNDNVNNNNTTDNHAATLVSPCQGGARPKTKPAGPARVSGVFRLS